MTLAADFAWDCLNDQRYEEALDIFERLLDLEVSAVPDDFDFLGLEELNGENITNLDLTRLALSVLYADYQLTKPEERAESLYSYFIYSIFRDIHVEDILRMGREELDGLDRFWEDWIALLETKAEQTATRLLREAALYYGGTEGLARIAARISENSRLSGNAALCRNGDEGDGSGHRRQGRDCTEGCFRGIL